jgi:hypothetical protein
MADEVVYVMHRRAVVRRDSDRAAVSTKGVAYRVGDFGEAMDAPVAYEFREADEAEARDNEQKLKKDVDARIDELLFKAAVARRVEELRREGYRGKG